MVKLIFFAGASLLGILLRLGALVPQLHDLAASRVEFAVPTNSWKRTSEGLYLYEAQTDPYSGDMVHETPLCLALFSGLKKINPVLVDCTFAVCDILTALVLYAFAKLFTENTVISEHKEKSKYAKDSLQLMLDFDSQFEVPRMVFLWYLWNPFIIGSYYARTTTIFTNLLLAAALYFASKAGNSIFRVLSMISLGFAAYQTLYAFLLFPPLHLYLTRTGSKNNINKTDLILDLFVFLGVLGSLLFVSSLIMGSWSFIRGVYGFLIYAPDLTPNIGLFWYFFTEMFEQFRLFFVWIFFMNICIYSIPVTMKLRQDPAFAFFILLPLITVFKPYPSYGDIGFYISLLPIWRHVVAQMKQILVISVLMLIAVSVFPILWKLWLEQGSANANFYYALTLVLATAQVFLVTDLMLAHEKRKWHLNFGKNHVDENGKKLELRLQ